MLRPPRPLALAALLLALGVALAGCTAQEPEEATPGGEGDAAADRGGIGESGVDADAPPEAPLGADEEPRDDAAGSA